MQTNQEKLIPKIKKLFPEQNPYRIFPAPITSESISVIKNWISKQKITKFEKDGFIESFIEHSNPFSFNKLISRYTSHLNFIYTLPVLESKLIDKILYNLTDGVLNDLVEFIQSKTIKPVKTDIAYSKLSENWKKSRDVIPFGLQVKYNIR